MIMSILQDKETQLRGIVIIWYGIGQQKFGNRTSQYYQIWNAMPTRLAGYHHCSEDQKIVSPLIPMVSSILESASLCRIRFHHGKYLLSLSLSLSLSVCLDCEAFNELPG